MQVMCIYMLVQGGVFMNHIHIPDGILPGYLWISGYVLTFVIMFILLKRVEQDNVRKKIPFTGVVGAIMLITMNVPLGIIPLHLSLAVLCGILVGPTLGFISVFVINVIMALFGHGGITSVGINTLVISSEVFIGYHAFKLLIRSIPKVWSSVIAVCLALLVSTSLMVGIVGSTVGLHETLPHHVHEESVGEAEQGEKEKASVFQETLSEVHYLSLTGWSAVIAILIAGIALESFITSLIVRFFMKHRPDFIVANNLT
jgi:cobalt/nickel transport system permease protein